MDEFGVQKIRERFRSRKSAVASLEAPDDSGRGPVIVLRRAQVMRVQIVGLKAPGEILEGKFVIGPAANINQDRVVDKDARVHVPNAGHAVHERAPFSDVAREPQAADKIVLLLPRAKVTT